MKLPFAHASKLPTIFREVSTPFGRCHLLTADKWLREKEEVVLDLWMPENKTYISLYLFPHGGELGLHFNYWVTDAFARRLEAGDMLDVGLEEVVTERLVGYFVKAVL